MLYIILQHYMGISPKKHRGEIELLIPGSATRCSIPLSLQAITTHLRSTENKLNSSVTLVC